MIEHLLYSKIEASVILGLTDARSDEATAKAIDRLVDSGQLDATVIFGVRKFSRDALMECIARLTPRKAG